MGDEREPWIGSSWMVSTMPGGDRPRPRIVLTWAVGVVVLLGVLGAAGPHPVTAALPLPPVDTSEVGATGRLPEDGVAPLPLPTSPETPPTSALPLPGSGSGSGVPETMLAAYRGAETSMAAAAPGCHLSWALVAGIGRVESGHAYGGAVSADGTTERPILGPQLDGTGGNTAIRDTDGGALDHDTVWDRAVGPTQFIPSSWRTYGADGNGDGTADPDNAFDAALATGRYLCAGGTDLATASGRHDAVFRYNHSESYVATVLRWADAYASGALPVPDSDGGIPDPVLASGSPTLAALPGPSSVPTTGGTGLLGGGPTPVGVPAGLPPVVPGSRSAPRPAAPSSSSSGAPSGLLPGTPPLGVPTGSPPGTPSAGAPTGLVPGTPSAGAPGPSAGAPGSSSAVPGSSSPAPGGASSARPTSSTVTAPRPVTPPTRATPPASATTAPPSTTTTAPRPTVPAAQRCTASLPAVAKAFAVPVGELTAATSDGPEPGQTTCTVSRSGKPLVVAVAATTAAAPAPVPGAGVTRTIPGGKVVLSVPPSAGVPAATAGAALTKLVAAWA